jgi:SAM-dependent methyltransferase
LKHEPLFNETGFYRFLVETNVLLHREAAALIRDSLGRRIEGVAAGKCLRVLDLACGALPITVAEVLGAFPACRFDYLGIDINPDQVAAARRFSFPGNVAATVLEGNAWDLAHLGHGGGFDLVFSGMNLHHGTPAEWSCLARQLRDQLADGGQFFAHDVYRPVGSPYFPRPDLRDPNANHAEMRLIPELQLSPEVGLPDSDFSEWAESEPTWRSDYLARMQAVLLERGAAAVGVESTIAHMKARDFPLTTNAFRLVFEQFGFTVDIRNYDDCGEPMAPYVALCIAEKV